MVVKRSSIEKLLSPSPAGKLVALRDFGIDLTLIAANLKLTPEQRLRKLQAAMISFDSLKKEAAKSRRIDQ